MSYKINLEPHLQKQVDHNINGLDIIHGELKNLMYEVEQEMFNPGVDQEILSYLTGKLDALTGLYKLTYDLSFAIMDKEEKQ